MLAPAEFSDYSAVIIFSGFMGGIAPDVDLGGKSMSIPNSLFKIASLPFAWCSLDFLPASQQAALSVLICGAFWFIADWCMKHRGVTHTWLGALCTGFVISCASVQMTDSRIAELSFLVAALAHLQHLFIDDLTSSEKAISKGKTSRLVLVSIRPVTFKSKKELIFISVLTLAFGYVFYSNV